MRRSRARLYALGCLVILALWGIVSAFYPPVIVPSPGETLSALLALAQEGALFRQVGVTVWRILAAFGISALLGASVGILAGLIPWLYPLLKPAADLAIGAPPVAWLVLALIWFGTGSATPIFTVVVVATPTIFANAYAGVCAVDRDLLGMARVFGARWPVLLEDIYLPAVIPHLFAGLTVAGSLSVRLGVMGELLGSDAGIGSALALARIYLETPTVFAWVAVTVMLVILLEGGVLRPLQRRAEAWRYKV